MRQAPRHAALGQDFNPFARLTFWLTVCGVQKRVAADAGGMLADLQLGMIATLPQRIDQVASL
ncbi:hypothetical protein CCR95_09135 [Thiocystis minor]|nr:hypothetical protein [Thiocystis minor]